MHKEGKRFYRSLERTQQKLEASQEKEYRYVSIGNNKQARKEQDSRVYDLGDKKSARTV